MNDDLTRHVDDLLKSAGLGALPPGGPVDDLDGLASSAIGISAAAAVHEALAERMPDDPLQPADSLNLALARGVVSIEEVWRAALPHAKKPAGRRLLRRLARRIFYRRLAEAHGEDIRRDLGESVVELGRLPDLPQSVYEGGTGLVCMDAIIDRLTTVGLVARTPLRWLAAWLIHHRGADWRAVYDYFAAHRLDIEEAYDRLDLQEVAGILASRPFFFTRDDVKKLAGDRFCGCCRAECPFAGDKGEVARRVFEI